MDAQQVAALTVQPADIRVLGAADQELLLRALDDALDLDGRRDITVHQPIQQFGRHIIAAALKQIGRGLQALAQRAVARRGAAPHRDQKAIADEELRLAEDGAFSLDLDRDGDDQDHVAVVDDLRTPVGFQHLFLVLVAGAQLARHLGKRFGAGVAQADPQHALALAPGDVLAGFCNGDLAVPPSVHVGDRCHDLALGRVGGLCFSRHRLPRTNRSLPRSVWLSADDSSAR